MARLYQVYCAPVLSAAMVPQALLEEIGAAYENRPLDLYAQAQKQADYLRLNPAGRVPTLVDGDLVLFETGAIVLHLLGKHRDSGLMPEPGTAAHSLFLQWLFYLATTPQVTFVEYTHPERWAADAADHKRVQANAVIRLEEQFGILDRAIGDKPFFLGETFSALDIHLTVLVRWSRSLPKPMWQWPQLRRIADKVHRRPAFQRMMQKQGFAWADNWPAD
jgi:glutathione S-transferase